MPGLRRLRAAGCGLATIIVLLALAPVASADVTLALTATSRDAIAGEPLAIDVTVTNPTAAPIEDVAVTVQKPPAGVELVAASSPAGACDIAVTRSCPAGTLEPNNLPQTVRFTVVADAGAAEPDATFRLAFRSSIAGVNDSALDVATVLRIPGSTTLVASGAPVNDTPFAPGDEVAYDLAVANTGGTAAAGIVIDAALPAGATVVEMPTDCTLSAPGAVRCLPPGGLLASQTVTRQIKLGTSGMTAPGSITVTGSDAAGDHATVTFATRLAPYGPADVQLTLQDSPDPVLDGGPLRLLVKLENLTPATTARDVVATVQLPAGTTVAELDPACSAVGSSLTCAVPRLLPGEVIPLVTKVDVGVVASEQQLTTSATSTVGSGDPDMANNADVRQTLVEPVMELAKAIAAVPAQVTGATLLARPGVAPANLLATTRRVGFGIDNAPYAILTTGDVNRIADDTALKASLDGGTTLNGAYDATVLAIDLDVPATARCLRFDFRFYSEEWTAKRPRPDSFVAELAPPGGGPAWSVDGSVVTAPGSFARVNAVEPAAPGNVDALISSGNAIVYDGGTQRLRAGTTVAPGHQRLLLSLFDVGSPDVDSAVLLDDLVLGPETGAACRTGVYPSPPTLVITSSKVNEADGFASVTLGFDGNRVAPEDIHVVLTPVAGTARLGADVGADPKDVTIEARSPGKTIRWPIVNDGIDEPDETFRITATADHALVGGDETVTITDDDPPPFLSLDDPKPVLEGAAGTTVVPVTLRLTGRSAADTRVRVRTVDLTARADTRDYEPISGVYTIPAGRGTLQVKVRVNGDKAREPDEQFKVVADRPEGLTIVDDTATVTIRNDDTDVPVTTKRKPLRLTAVATAGKVKRGRSAGYRIWVRNPNRQAVGLTSLSVCLPSGFTYVARSGQGPLRGVPKRGRCGKTGVLLTWRRAVTIPAGASLKTRFGVRVGKRKGVFRISLSGTARTPWTVRRSGPVARIRVH